MPGRLTIDSRVALVLTALVLEAAYALLVLWPMRIWSGDVSPYTHLVGVFGINRGGALRYVATVLLLFALYGIALFLVVRAGRRVSLVPVLAGAAVFCGTLVLTHPLTSTDVFNYIASARVQWAHGANPLVTPPRAFPADPLYGLVLNWRDVPSPYGPLWSLLTAVPHAAGRNDPLATVVAFKATSAAFLLAAGAFVAGAADRLRPGSGVIAALALTWNPMVVWHVAGNGHNDAVMICLLALAIYLLARDRPGPAVVALTASALVKFATLILAPMLIVWWWRRGRQPSLRALAPWIAAAVAMTALAYAPYWDGTATLRAALDEGAYFAVSGPAALRGALVRVMDVSAAEALAAWSGRLTFLAAYIAILVRMRRGTVEELVAGGALVLSAYLLLAATYFSPWHVLWPLTLAVVVPWRRDVFAGLLTFSLTAMSVLVWATWARARFAPVQAGDWYPMHLLSFVSVAPLPVAVWVWLGRRDAKRNRRASADVEAPVLQREVAGTGIDG